MAFPQYNFKTSRQPICSTKSYKNDNYDRTTYKVSPYCYIPQANLITRLFTPPRLMLDHYRGEASLTQCYSEPVFQIQFPICGVNFSNNILMTQVRVNERETELGWTFEAIIPQVNYLPINFPRKFCSPLAKLFLRKKFPTFCRDGEEGEGESRHYNVYSYLFPFVKVSSFYLFMKVSSFTVQTVTFQNNTRLGTVLCNLFWNKYCFKYKPNTTLKYKG